MAKAVSDTTMEMTAQEKVQQLSEAHRIAIETLVKSHQIVLEEMEKAMRIVKEGTIETNVNTTIPKDSNE